MDQIGEDNQPTPGTTPSPEQPPSPKYQTPTVTFTGETPTHKALTMLPDGKYPVAELVEWWDNFPDPNKIITHHNFQTDQYFKTISKAQPKETRPTPTAVTYQYITQNLHITQEEIKQTLGTNKPSMATLHYLIIAIAHNFNNLPPLQLIPKVSDHNIYTLNIPLSNKPLKLSTEQPPQPTPIQPSFTSPSAIQATLNNTLNNTQDQTNTLNAIQPFHHPEKATKSFYDVATTLVDTTPPTQPTPYPDQHPHTQLLTLRDGISWNKTASSYTNEAGMTWKNNKFEYIPVDTKPTPVEPRL